MFSYINGHCSTAQPKIFEEETLRLSLIYILCELNFKDLLDYHCICSYVLSQDHEELIFEAAVKSTITAKFIVLNVSVIRYYI